MKYSIALLAAAGAAVAQLESLPACGQTCIGNMVGIATDQFGCAAGDINCYCTYIDFGYGVRDCSNEACSSSDEALQVITFGTNYCAQALASAGDAASTIVASGLSVLSSAAAGATGSASDGDDGPASTPVTTSPLEATVTGTDGSVFVTTTGLVTLYGPAGGAATTTGAIDSALSSASDAAGSGLSSASDAASSVISSIADAAGSAAADASDAAGSATGSEGAAPMMTAAPYLAGAGLAALLLI